MERIIVFDASCIFCKIIKGDIPSTKIKETDTILVIADIAPKAPVHYLILPKNHIKNISALQRDDDQFVLDSIKVAQELSMTLQQPASFNLVTNNGEAAGQSVFHLHWHFISGAHLWKGL